jgi:hypothetical protein
MTLSDRLKAAEYERRLAAGLPVDHLTPPDAPQAKLRLERSEPVIDLTQSWSSTVANAAKPATSEAPTMQLPQVGDRSRVECEQCGGACQIDLVDAVNHTVSLSCLTCFHMFRVPLDN